MDFPVEVEVEFHVELQDSAPLHDVAGWAVELQLVVVLVSFHQAKAGVKAKSALRATFNMVSKSRLSRLRQGEDGKLKSNPERLYETLLSEQYFRKRENIRG